MSRSQPLAIVLAFVSVSGLAHSQSGSPVATFPGSATGVTRILALNGRLVMIANEPATGTELWTSDGTSAGTAAVDIQPGPGSSTPNVEPCVVGNRAYFQADDGVHGAELWSSDGTAAGTAMVLDLNPGPASSAPGALIAWNGRLIFAADDGVHGREAFVSDGTATGTQLFADFNPGPGSSSPLDFLGFGNQVVCSATDSAHGYEAWVSDGTPAGTILLGDINPGPANSFPIHFVAAGTRVYFAVIYPSTGGLWRTDGTPAGTQLVTWQNSVPRAMINGWLIVAGYTSFVGAEVFRNDGSMSPSQLVYDLAPGPNSGFGPSYLKYRGQIYFGGTSPAYGDEIYRSDGSSVQLAADLNPGPASSGVGVSGSAGGALFFSTARSDGTPAGTQVIPGLPGWAGLWTLLGPDLFAAVETSGTHEDLYAVRGVDLDLDGVLDWYDNCVGRANPGQGDCDGDGVGDACAIAAGATDANADGIPDSCETSGGTPFCFGDGSGTACPCANESLPLAQAGCLNSSLAGAALRGAGNASISADALGLDVTHLPGGVSCLLFQAANTVAGGQGALVGDGLVCINGNARRLVVRAASAAGTLHYPQAGDPLISVLGFATAGQSLNYQVWHRDPASYCTAATTNFTNALRVLWQP